jgi:hypothetical protein
MLRRTPLKPGGSLARTGPLSRRSPGLCATKRAQRKAYKEAAETCCAACGTYYQVTPSHCLTQKMFPQHRNDMRNVVWLCWPHHQLWENDKAGFKAAFPAIWQVKLDIMQALEPAYFELFQLKNPTLFP